MKRGKAKYLQITAYVLIIVILFIVIGISRNCGRLQYAPVEGFSGGDTIDIAIVYGPGSYYVYDDSLTGINVVTADIFSKETLTPVKIWPVTDPASGLAKLESGAFDILASLPLDNNVKKNFPVSESIFLDRLVLIQLADSVTGKTEVNSSLDLNGKSVHVAAGSSAVNRLQNLSNEIGGKIEIIEEPEISDELLTLQVANGSIPLAVVNERVARKLTEDYPDLRYDSTVSFTQFQVWVFNPSDSLIYSKFNAWFDQFHSTDNYRSLINKF